MNQSQTAMRSDGRRMLGTGMAVPAERQRRDDPGNENLTLGNIAPTRP